MRDFHAVGSGSIPGRDKFLGDVLSGLYDKCQEALGPRGPRISFGHHNHPSHILVRMNV